MGNRMDLDNATAICTEIGNKRQETFSASETELKDTVGWVGKNIAESVYVNANVNQYLTALYIKADLQPNTQYILSFDTTNVGNEYYTNEKISGEHTVTIINGTNSTQFFTKSDLDKTIPGHYDEELGWLILKNNKHQPNIPSFTNVMLRKASISDSTYEPYHPSVEEVVENIRSEQRVLGAWNVLKYPYYQTTKTENGVTFTDNGDGSITISGTATAETQFFYQGKSAFYTPPKGNYVFKIDQVVSGIQYVVEAYNGDTWVKSFGTLYSPYDKLVDVNIDYNGFDRVAIYMKVLNGTVVSSPVTVKAVLSLSESNEFQPYAMTNRELTEELTVQESEIDTTYTVGDLGNHLVKYGKIVNCVLRLNGVTATSWDVIGNVPSGFRPKYLLRFHDKGTDNNKIQVGTDGKVYTTSSLNNSVIILSDTWITS